MIQRKIIDIALWLLLGIGFLGAINVSYANFSGNECPQIGIIPICYVVLVAYALMIVALLLRSHSDKYSVFFIGWATAFAIALVGSGAELFGGGGVCPTSSGGSLFGVSISAVPMCYVSLALTIIILGLFLKASQLIRVAMN